MILFGGIYEITKELNDLHIFDFSKNTWVTLFEESNSPLKLRDSPSPYPHSFDNPMDHTGLTNMSRGKSNVSPYDRNTSFKKSMK